MTETRFALGTLVEWESISNGSMTVKQGKVVGIVSPETAPNFASLSKALNGASCPPYPGRMRDHESYIVHVPPKTGKGAGKLYWPRVKHLRERT